MTLWRQPAKRHSLYAWRITQKQWRRFSNGAHRIRPVKRIPNTFPDCPCTACAINLRRIEERAGQHTVKTWGFRRKWERRGRR